MTAICLQAISRSSSISSIAGSAESVPCGNVITANVGVSDFLIPFSLVSPRSSALLLIADKLDSQYVLILHVQLCDSGGEHLRATGRESQPQRRQ